jgi:hypothetical protein
MPGDRAPSVTPVPDPKSGSDCRVNHPDDPNHYARP